MLSRVRKLRTLSLSFVVLLSYGMADDFVTRAQYDELVNAVETLMEQMAAAQAKNNELEGELSATKTELATTKAELATTKAELGDVRGLAGVVSGLEARVDALEGPVGESAELWNAMEPHNAQFSYVSGHPQGDTVILETTTSGVLDVCEGNMMKDGTEVLFCYDRNLGAHQRWRVGGDGVISVVKNTDFVLGVRNGKLVILNRNTANAASITWSLSKTGTLSLVSNGSTIRVSADRRHGYYTGVVA